MTPVTVHDVDLDVRYQPHVHGAELSKIPAVRHHTHNYTHTWVSARAGRTDTGGPSWLTLGDLLCYRWANTRIRLHLPKLAAGATGHVTIARAYHELLCLRLDHSDGSTWNTIHAYRQVDPVWVHAQPPHIRALLDAIQHCHVEAPEPAPASRSGRLARLLHLRHRPIVRHPLNQLATRELAATVQPLLDLPAQEAETIAAAVRAHRPEQAPDLAQVLNLSHAL